MPDQIDPSTQATQLREQAAALDGADREYCLWLAQEWEKSAARFGHAGSRHPRAQGALRSLQRKR